jgi:hypothetical protein
MQIRIEEAIARAKQRGKKVKKIDIARRLWPDSSRAAQIVNMGGLCNGRTTKVSPEWVAIICEMLDCSADFLFGISND